MKKPQLIPTLVILATACTIFGCNTVRSPKRPSAATVPTDSTQVSTQEAVPNKPESLDVDAANTPDTMFCFLGNGVDPDTHAPRPENFDKCPYDVTENNVQILYRKYEVTPVEGTDLYKITPHQLYTTSRYFTRLLKFKDGKQVAARTFYAWKIPYIFVQGDKYMIGLNSLATTAGMNTSTFTCKTLLLDSNLKTIKEREYKYPEQKDIYEYAYIDTLYRHNNGYNFRIINTGFDSDDYFEYTGFLSSDNVVTKSSKRVIQKDKTLQ